MAYMKMRKGINISRVVSKIAVTTLVLYVGGYLVAEIGNVINGTTSPFNNGFKIIGWTVTSNQVTNTTGGGVLTVVGIIGFASIVMEFVDFRF